MVYQSMGFIVGKDDLRMVLEFVSSITQRSMPIPMPPSGHAVFQSRQELLVQHLGLVVAALALLAC